MQMEIVDIIGAVLAILTAVFAAYRAKPKGLAGVLTMADEAVKGVEEARGNYKGLDDVLKRGEAKLADAAVELVSRSTERKIRRAGKVLGIDSVGDLLGVAKRIVQSRVDLVKGASGGKS